MKSKHEELTMKMQLGTPRVFPLTGRTGKPVANQYVLKTRHGYVFQSYESYIAVYDIDTKELVLGCDWDYSRTTQKYLWKFLREYAPRWVNVINAHGKRTGAENIRAAIDAGEILFLDGLE